MSYPKKIMTLFMEGQSSIVRHGNIYAVTSHPVSPLVFDGRFKSLFSDSTCSGNLSVCEIELGAISFDIGKNKEYENALVCFYNLTATMFPWIGHYKVTGITSK